MKIIICYADGNGNTTGKCRVFGFSRKGVDEGLTVHAVFELPDIPELATEILDCLDKFRSDYHDAGFNDTVPQSANIVTGIIEMILLRESHEDVPYRIIFRNMERSDLFTKVERSLLAPAQVAWA